MSMLNIRNFIILGVVSATSWATAANEVQISGNVASKCTIYTSTNGIYGNPTADVLSTATADGGTPAVIRYDVVNAGTYKAVITTPVSFSTSPSLNDTLAWTGSTSVSEVTDASMSAYDSSKRVFDNVTEFDLTIAGTVWFGAESKVEYGYGKSLPGGSYKAVVTAECIAL